MAARAERVRDRQVGRRTRAENSEWVVKRKKSRFRTHKMTWIGMRRMEEQDELVVLSRRVLRNRQSLKTEEETAESRETEKYPLETEVVRVCLCAEQRDERREEGEVWDGKRLNDVGYVARNATSNCSPVNVTLSVSVLKNKKWCEYWKNTNEKARVLYECTAHTRSCT